MQSTADSSQAQQPLINHPSQLPAVDKLLLSEAMQHCASYGLDACTQAVREVIGELRTRVLAGEAQPLDHSQMLAMARQRLEKRLPHGCARSSTSREPCCTPTWAAPCCLRRP